MNAERMNEKIAIWLSWKLPRVIVYWATLRLFANATTGEHSADHPDDVSIFDALKRWEQQ